MEASRTRPGGLMLPSPVDSVESLASSSSNTSSRSSLSDSPGDVNNGEPEPERSGNVMITLSLTPDPPRSTPSRQPFPRSHIRSRSLADDPGSPAMIRAHSSPGLDSRGRYIFVNGRGSPANMAENTPKRYLPLQLSYADSFEPRMLHRKNISETISEHAELDTSGSSSAANTDFYLSSPVLSHSTPRIGRRRPSSPLHVPQTPSIQVAGSPLSSASSSPVILSSRFNESFPSYSVSSASSMPSTPTSLRSRSPSISSLETIPDIPDAEAAAIEADRIAALKAAADRADDADANSVSRRRGISDMSGPSSFANTRSGRKRWSVCGAERRQDLDLETIWED
ncbi:hypothetical protein AN5026.2 [Aspergillus nidulans FGSC A4]|uniref:Uncharacterized protein n=1 Tax=Emericella nidulans (strain FGSC A4 / ATCC 38163 / CBS 112.46 / NRRL 194 / M139) TaxID=227321 RepID=Q5B354_EMENI|nr:hypothetical protein [Aspergillus nidulans FGSC A4]EAA61104.1 hypothetical protein AN5026.2 [Aspergillus nidulans FGSC A4]CBF76253.1 TPA: hypothetical protein ANIA_05026 [Aspergillus nidulans FGSC A4]|eukprot:XP_662630.1 hypothetical protein AN5026.2 [Aspergillus nidulans FGSC A4]